MITPFRIKVLQSALVKIKLTLLNGMYLIILQRFPNKLFCLNRFLGKVSTELQYLERSVFLKEVNTQSWWALKLRTQEGVNVPIWVIRCFQQQIKQDSQNLNNDTFYRPPVTGAQCIIGTEISLTLVF